MDCVLVVPAPLAKGGGRGSCTCLVFCTRLEWMAKARKEKIIIEKNMLFKMAEGESWMPETRKNRQGPGLSPCGGYTGCIEICYELKNILRYGCIQRITRSSV